MSIWLAVSLILAVTAIYMVTIEIFSVAFKLTGLATNKLKFQVASLFTGAGFTTAESELITNDDRRRKIAMTCMYTGHIFSVVIMGLVINLLISINDLSRDNKEWYFIVFYVSLGVFLLVLFIKIPPINKRFQRLLENIAINTSKRKRETNIVTVLDYYGRSAVVEVILNKIPDYANETSLYDMKLTNKYSLILLSLRRGNRRIQISKDTMLTKGDVIVAYGLINDIRAAFVDSLDNNKKNNTIVINNTNEIQLLNNYGQNALMEIVVNEVPKELEGVPMKDSHLVDRYSLQIVIIKRKNEYLFVNKDMIIKKGDVVTLFGPMQSIKHLFKNDDK
jgi:Trk K+ transport system NAD-binding subunit